MKEFDYIRPQSLEEACAALRCDDRSVKPLAGGTDLIVQMKDGGLRPKALVSLRDVPGLRFIRLNEDGSLEIGAATTLAAIENSPDVLKHFPAIAEAASFIGSVQVRERATVGGNLCNAAPSADTASILVAYGAQATIGDGSGERTVPLEEFFTGPGQTVLRPGEILVKITVPAPPANSFGKYYKTFRSAMDCCTVGVAICATFAEGSAAVRDVRLVMGAVAPTPMRAPACEGLVRGAVLDDELITTVGARAAEEIRPIDDVRASAAYRRVLADVLTRRALAAARSWAQEGVVA
jgi:aerobic carbon-monoxide dehydrogenase medium subunit